MNNAVAQGKFKGIKVGRDGIEVSILQYADDTMLVGSWDNLWR